MAHAGYNKNSSAVKRIMQEARELSNDPSTDYSAAPLEDDIFEWHCTLRGPSGTEFEGGLYHFRILLPSEYPFRAPSLMMLTPNGRFELNTKICISFTSYHEELWQPAWGVRTAIIGLQGFFPLKGTAAAGVGAIEYPSVEPALIMLLLGQETGYVLVATNRTLSISRIPQKLRRQKQPDAQQPPAPAPITPSRTIPLVAPTPTRPVVPINLTPNTPVFIGPSTPVDETPPDDFPSSTETTTTASSAIDGETREVLAAAQPAPPVILRRSTPRPPLILDTAICVLLVLVFALICRRVL
ncbi:hypothetical protein EUX98_g327 [Antrodiella citrinella]|uniref:UBC core domain-containing protein n=1 Tax=Antrodiella citrinella TaxID=2447956 RepID=A0A4S4N756_9APHY|nr:hypothetical protein EUX98_g327 [Antrodiella citrinella]